MSVLDREHPWPWLIVADVCFFLSGLAVGYGLWH